MIRFALACDAGHAFESWFGNGDAFDDLSRRRLVACPECGSTAVSKAVMAPAVVTARPQPATADAVKVDPARMDLTLLDERRREARRVARALRARIIAGTQDVGARFPDEARRMHEGEIPHREIRGQATLDEARSLLEDGVGILPLPGLPDELN